MQLHNFKENLIKWAIVCTICATPSFILATTKMNANIPAMIVGVVIFIFIYAYANSTNIYKNIHNNKTLLRKSLKFGYGLKIFLAIVGTIPAVIFTLISTKDMGFLITFFFPDVYMGMISILLISFIAGEDNIGLLKCMKTYEDRREVPPCNEEFFSTLFITLTEGIIMSIAIMIVVLIVWLDQLAWKKPTSPPLSLEGED